MKQNEVTPEVVNLKEEELISPIQISLDEEGEIVFTLGDFPPAAAIQTLEQVKFQCLMEIYNTDNS